ncbi:MAG: DUF2059 domain-containing protein [Ignavibacteriae bacterium]|nr:DUF2059 domain-containing protein [Ignavibacteriota bacterium]
MKKTFLVVTLLVVCVIMGNTHALAQKNKESDAKEAKQQDILRLLTLNGTTAFGSKVFDEQINAIKSTYPELSEDFWSKIMKDISPLNMAIKAIPAYDKRYSTSEIKELIKFFESPIGKKYASNGGDINAEVMNAWKNWGAEFAKTIGERLKELAKSKEKKK